MSILITGMEMPTNEPLIVKINPDGSVSTTWKNDYKKYKAILVPPHGRLGDLDSMEKEMCGGCVHGEHKYANCIDCALANAHTIIEAEDDE